LYVKTSTIGHVNKYNKSFSIF